MTLSEVEWRRNIQWHEASSSLSATAELLVRANVDQWRTRLRASVRQRTSLWKAIGSIFIICPNFRSYKVETRATQNSRPTSPAWLPVVQLTRRERWRQRWTSGGTGPVVVVAWHPAWCSSSERRSRWAGWRESIATRETERPPTAPMTAHVRNTYPTTLRNVAILAVRPLRSWQQRPHAYKDGTAKQGEC